VQLPKKSKHRTLLQRKGGKTKGGEGGGREGGRGGLSTHQLHGIRIHLTLEGPLSSPCGVIIVVIIIIITGCEVPDDALRAKGFGEYVAASLRAENLSRGREACLAAPAFVFFFLVVKCKRGRKRGARGLGRRRCAALGGGDSQSFCCSVQI